MRCDCQRDRPRGPLNKTLHITCTIVPDYTYHHALHPHIGFSSPLHTAAEHQHWLLYKHLSHTYPFFDSLLLHYKAFSLLRLSVFFLTPGLFIVFLIVSCLSWPFACYMDYAHELPMLCICSCYPCLFYQELLIIQKTAFGIQPLSSRLHLQQFVYYYKLWTMLVMFSAALRD